MRLALPALESFLAENVEKEVRKDARVIRCASAAVAAGVAPTPEAVRQLLAAAREIDREFLARVSRFPVRIDIPYSELEPLRLRRIELGLDLAYRLLQGWNRGEKARSAVTREELSLRLRELLELYAHEVLALSRTVRLPGPLAALRERIAQRLRSEMAEIARTMTATLARP
ncbi:MAG TPA: hypothetical protein VL280_01715 [Burkholderiales bacterium]|nr:hypothetical protein [Burkholderiales bacterium]